jgi:hypothetical protein
MRGNCCAEQTLANVPQGGQRLWAAVVFAYAFNLHALWLLDKEYTEYSELRQDFLCYGDADLVPQTRYTAMVEYLPAELRSGVALAAYYDALFPGDSSLFELRDCSCALILRAIKLLGSALAAAVVCACADICVKQGCGTELLQRAVCLFLCSSLLALIPLHLTGQVHSAVICQNLSKLESLVQRRAKTVRRLERARARRIAAEAAVEESTSRLHDIESRGSSSSRYGSCDCAAAGAAQCCCGDDSAAVDRARAQAERAAAAEHKLADALATLNGQVCTEQQEALAAAERMNSRDEEVLSALKRRAMRGLRSLGELLGSGRLSGSRQPGRLGTAMRSLQSTLLLLVLLLLEMLMMMLAVAAVAARLRQM